MKTVWKYVLEPSVEQDVVMPQDWTALYVGNQYEKICLWAQVDPSRSFQKYRFHIAVTGGPVPEDADYLGSALFAGGELVFHIYAETA